MAIITTHLLASVLTPLVEVAAHILRRSVTFAATGIANGDNVQLLTIGRNCRLFNSFLVTSATLGAGATLQLQRNRGGTRVNLTAATTAGGASVVNGDTIGPVDLQSGDIIEALVGGANVAASATVSVDLLVQSA